MSKLEELCSAYHRFNFMLSIMDYTSQFVGLVKSTDDHNSDTLCMMFGTKEMKPFEKFGNIIHTSVLDLDPIDAMIKMYEYCTEVIEKESEHKK